MISIKNTKGLSKSELEKLNSFIDLCYNTSNVYDDIDTHNVLSNDYVIYEAYDNKVSGYLGIITSNSDKVTVMNHLHISAVYTAEKSLILAAKLIDMVKMIAKNTLMVILKKSDCKLIEFYHKLDFAICKCEVDYDADTEVVLTKSI